MASSWNDNNKKEKDDSKEIVFWYCNKKDSYQDGHYKRKREEANKICQSSLENDGRTRELDDTNKEINIVVSKSETKEEKAMSALQTTNVDSGVTTHMVMDNLIVSTPRDRAGARLEWLAVRLQKIGVKEYRKFSGPGGQDWSG